MDKTDNAKWAQVAAEQLNERRGDIDTGCYIECEFMQAAAQLAIQDAEIAARTGALMEPPRDRGHWLKG